MTQVSIYRPLPVGSLRTTSIVQKHIPYVHIVTIWSLPLHCCIADVADLLSLVYQTKVLVRETTTADELRLITPYSQVRARGVMALYRITTYSIDTEYGRP